MKITDPTEFSNFRYPHYVWRVPIVDPMPAPRLPFWALSETEKRIRYHMVVSGFYNKTNILAPEPRIEQRVDIDVKVSDNDEEEQDVILTLNHNKFTEADENRTLSKHFRLTDWSEDRTEHLEYIRKVIILEMLQW